MPKPKWIQCMGERVKRGSPKHKELKALWQEKLNRNKDKVKHGIEIHQYKEEEVLAVGGGESLQSYRRDEAGEADGQQSHLGIHGRRV